MPMNWLKSMIREVVSKEMRDELKPIMTILKSFTILEGNQIKIMATIADLDAALAANNTAIQSLSEGVATLGTIASKVESDVTALIAKVEAGAPAVDVTNELNSIQSQNANIVAAAQAIKAATDGLTASDAVANPAPAPAPATTETAPTA